MINRKQRENKGETEGWYFYPSNEMMLRNKTGGWVFDDGATGFLKGFNYTVWVK